MRWFFMSSKLISEKQQHGKILFFIGLPMYKENLLKLGPLSLKCQPWNAREHHIAALCVSALSCDHSSTFTLRGAWRLRKTTGEKIISLYLVFWMLSWFTQWNTLRNQLWNYRTFPGVESSFPTEVLLVVVWAAITICWSRCKANCTHHSSHKCWSWFWVHSWGRRELFSDETRCKHGKVFAWLCFALLWWFFYASFSHIPAVLTLSALSVPLPKEISFKRTPQNTEPTICYCWEPAVKIPACTKVSLNCLLLFRFGIWSSLWFCSLPKMVVNPVVLVTWRAQVKMGQPKQARRDTWSSSFPVCLCSA